MVKFEKGNDKVPRGRSLGIWQTATNNQSDAELKPLPRANINANNSHKRRRTTSFAVILLKTIF